MDGPLQQPALLIKDDVHTANGLSCSDCHGGDRTSDDPTVAMSRAKGFIGKPKRTAIPQLCAKCHASPDYMRRFRPQQRVDQFELYKTSVHGKLLASGDENVATCIDCHSVHDIRAVKDAMAPVHPLRLPGHLWTLPWRCAKDGEVRNPDQSVGALPHQCSLGGAEERRSIGSHLRVVPWKSWGQAAAG